MKKWLLIVVIMTAGALAADVEFCAIDNFGGTLACSMTMSSCQSWIRNYSAGASCQVRQKWAAHPENEFCAVDNFGNVRLCVMTMTSCQSWLRTMSPGTSCTAMPKRE